MTATPDSSKIFYNRFLLIVAGLGGLLYGVLEAFGSQYIGTGLQDAVALVVLLLVLIVRPRGILGKATA